MMRWFGRMLLYALVGLVGVGCLLWFFGPREPVVLRPDFDPSVIGADVDAYLAAREARFDNIRDGVQKRVIWHGAPGARTRLSLLYVHGFSATSEEIRPVPDHLARALKANLVYTRLTGHGRDGAAMTEASVGAWMHDMAEALEVARRAGEEVIVLSTSTGGTLAALAARDPDMMRGVKAMAFISANFAINDPAARTLTWPGARYWLPHVAGRERCFPPLNDGHARFWTTCYPTVALLPMAAAVKAAFAADYSDVAIPALFRFSDADQVVRAEAIRDVADRWGGPVLVQPVTLGPKDDPSAHGIAGDITAPGQTAPTVAALAHWIEGL